MYTLFKKRLVDVEVYSLSILCGVCSGCLQKFYNLSFKKENCELKLPALWVN